MLYAKQSEKPVLPPINLPSVSKNQVPLPLLFSLGITQEVVLTLLLLDFFTSPGEEFVFFF